MKTDAELDQAIDAVAREMMSAEAPADLRARVQARIDDDRQRSGFDMPRWAWAGALTMLAAAVGTWIAWPVYQPRPGGSPASITASNTSVPPSIMSGATPSRGGNATPTATQSTNTGMPGRRGASGVTEPKPGLAWDAGPAPLPSPDPIAIDTLLPDALAVPGIDVTPLGEIQPITIPAASQSLPEPQRRDSR